MLPSGIDNPNLTDEERAGLELAHKLLVETGKAEWVTTDEA